MNPEIILMIAAIFLGLIITYFSLSIIDIDKKNIVYLTLKPELFKKDLKIFNTGVFLVAVCYMLVLVGQLSLGFRMPAWYISIYSTVGGIGGVLCLVVFYRW